MRSLPAFAAVPVLATGCANWRQGSTQAYYQGAILDAGGPAHDRLETERRVDSTVDAYLTRNGMPDAIYVASLRDIELIYVERDTLVHVHRSVASGFSLDFDWHGTVTEVHPLPDAILNLIPAFGDRVRQARAEQGHL
ncbi:MAG: hypothetical protein ABSA52_23000 [Candidatus Binatia bacterium]|jgi:hypothetical protein